MTKTNRNAYYSIGSLYLLRHRDTAVNYLQLKHYIERNLPENFSKDLRKNVLYRVSVNIYFLSLVF